MTPRPEADPLGATKFVPPRSPPGGSSGPARPGARAGPARAGHAARRERRRGQERAAERLVRAAHGRETGVLALARHGRRRPAPLLARGLRRAPARRRAASPPRRSRCTRGGRRASPSRRWSTRSTGSRSPSCSCSTTSTSSATRTGARRPRPAAAPSAREPPARHLHADGPAAAARPPARGGHAHASCASRPRVHAGRGRPHCSRASGVELEPEVGRRLWTPDGGLGRRTAARRADAARRTRPGGVRRAFAGDDVATADYLLDRGARAAAARAAPTSCCAPRSSTRCIAELADALTGRARTAAVLARLEREHALITVVEGNARTWFRYHPLLRELLQVAAALPPARRGPGAAPHARPPGTRRTRGLRQAIRHAAAGGGVGHGRRARLRALAPAAGPRRRSARSGRCSRRCRGDAVADDAELALAMARA